MAKQTIMGDDSFGSRNLISRFGKGPSIPRGEGSLQPTPDQMPNIKRQDVRRDSLDTFQRSSRRGLGRDVGRS